jgi:glycosyltransferase involved in cell wall biosynthesis
MGSAPFTFLYVGRLLGHKGIREYVAAAKRIQEENISAAFEVVGPLDTHNPSAISPSEIADWISAGIIRYHGGVADVRPYYQSCDVLVLPSYREGLSTVIVEALTMERPVIAADVPGCADALDSSCGWLVNPRNSAALVQQMKLTMRLSPGTLGEMGRKGRKRVQDFFSTEQSVQPYMKCLNRLLKSSVRPES